MRVDELFRSTELSRDEVLLRIKNSKSQAEKEKWAAYLVKNRYHLAEEALGAYFKRLVKKNKITKLGGGAFSQVFQHPQFRNVVTKVFTGKDTVYKRYLMWCMKHQNNPYAPKIIDKVDYESPDGEQYTIVFLQKMRKVGERGFVNMLPTLFPGIKDEELEDLKQAIKDYDMIDTFNELDSLIQTYGDEHFSEIWKHIKSYGKKKFDLHPGNVMLRGTQLVLTDPVAHDPTSRVDEI